MNLPTVPLSPFSDFETASRQVLALLHERFGFDLWMMTRTEGADWIVLQAEDHGYNVEDGAVFRWADSFCSQMVGGLGPCVAARATDVDSYANAPIGKQISIGAYIGVPLAREDGTLFGTLCAIDPDPQDPSIIDALPVVEMFARLLVTILHADIKAAENARLLERSQKLATTDSLTGLLNRNGWEQCIAAEEARSRRYGVPSCVYIIDLDGMKAVNDSAGHAHGDILLRRAARSLRRAVRESDMVARIGGDEFAILSVECDQDESEVIFHKIRNMLAADGISASVGKAMRDPRTSLSDAITSADLAMYAAKESGSGTYLNVRLVNRSA